MNEQMFMIFDEAAESAVRVEADTVEDAVEVWRHGRPCSGRPYVLTVWRRADGEDGSTWDTWTVIVRPLAEEPAP